MNNEYLAKREAVFGIAPMLTKERTHGFIALSALTCIYALAPWCFTQGGYVASMLGLKAAVTNSMGILTLVGLLFYAVVTIPAREGIDIWIYQRASLGTRGVVLIWFLVMSSTWGWIAVLAHIQGTSLGALWYIATGNHVSDTAVSWMSVSMIFIGAGIALLGPKIITYVSYVAVPGVILVCLIILYFCFTLFSWNDLLAIEAPWSTGNFRTDYFLASEWNLAYIVAWFPVLGVLPRLGKSTRKVYWSFIIGFSVVFAAMISVGSFGALAISEHVGYFTADPAEWFIFFGGGISVLSLLLLGLSNISITSVAFYSLGVSTKLVLPTWPFKRVTLMWVVWSSFLILAGVIWDYYHVFLALVGVICGPGIMLILVDYFLVRKRQISIRAMFKTEKGSPYFYTGGFNAASWIAFICGIIVYFSVYDPLNAVGRNFIFEITTGTGLSCLVTAVVYYALSRSETVNKYILKDR